MAATILETPFRAPSLIGPDAFGKKLSFDLFKGKWIVLYFYPKDMTPGCTVEATDFQTLSDDFEDRNAVIIGVSKDSCERHQKFADKEGLRFFLLSDEGGKLCEAYGVWKEKINYGRKYMGIERSTFLINPQHEIVAQWTKVRVADHAKDVLETLKACQKAALRPRK